MSESKRFLRAVRILAPVSIGLLLACGPDVPDGSEVERFHVDGTEIVLNPAEPLLSGDRASLNLRWTAPTGSEAAETWERPALVRASRGEVFVLDLMAERIHVRDADSGEPLSTVGRSGDGPGELRRPFGLAVHVSGLVVGNGGRGTLEWFSRSGEWERSLWLDAVGFVLHGMGSDRFLVNSFRPDQAGWWILDSDGGLESFEWPTWSRAPEADEECFRHGTSGALLLRLSCHRPMLQVVDETGQSIREVEIDRDVVQVDERRIREAVERNASLMQADGIPERLIEALARRMEEQYRLSQRWRGVRLDPGSGLAAIWEQEIEDLGGGPATLHLLSPSGVFVASLLAGESWVDFDLIEGGVYALVEDEVTGIVSLKAYDLEMPNGYVDGGR